MEQLVPLDYLVLPVHLVYLQLLVHQVLLVYQELPEPLVFPVQLVPQGEVELMEPLVDQEQLVQVVFHLHLELLDFLVLLVPLVCLRLPVLLV